VGMEAEEMAHANWRLDNPPVVDVAVSRRMGLFVVARLAARHGIRVRLRPAASRGLVALVWLPDEAITHKAPGTVADLGGSDPAMAPEIAARPVAEGIVTAGPGRGPGWATTGPQPSFRTVPRPAGESGTAPGETGPQPIVRPDEEPPAEPDGETVGADAQTTASIPFATGEDWFSKATPEPVVEDTPDEPDADAWGSGDADSWSSNDADSWSTSDAPSWSSATAPAPAEHFGTGSRLPIFEAVESDWFRQAGQAAARFSHAGPASGSWASPADAGWRAAEVVHSPSSGGVTSAGLPKRVPRANLVPGTAAAAAAEAGGSAAVPTRSAAATRDRFASFQQGARRGRAVADGEEAGGGEGESL